MSYWRLEPGSDRRSGCMRRWDTRAFRFSANTSRRQTPASVSVSHSRDQGYINPERERVVRTRGLWQGFCLLFDILAGDFVAMLLVRPCGLASLLRHRGDWLA